MIMILVKMVNFAAQYHEQIKMKYLNKLKLQIMDTNKNITLLSLLIPLYDILFYIFAYFGIKKYLYAIQNMIMELQGTEILALTQSLSKFNLESSYAVLHKFYIYVIGYTFLIMIFLIIIWSLSRYLIWQNITGKKFSLRSILKLIPANALWLIIVSIPLIILFLPFYSYVKIYGPQSTLPFGLSMLRIMLVAAVFVMFYFTDIMHLIYLKTNKVFSSMIQAFKKGTLKAYPMLVGYALVFALIYISSLLFKNLGTILGILDILIILALFTWVKIFFNQKLYHQSKAGDKLF